jgi:hypothetical protein
MRYFRENPELTEIAPGDMARIEARCAAALHVPQWARDYLQAEFEKPYRAEYERITRDALKTHEQDGSSAAPNAGGNFPKS